MRRLYLLLGLGLGVLFFLVLIFSPGGTSAYPSNRRESPESTPTPTSTPACALAWRVVPSPNVGTAGSNLLGAVAALSASDVWAVGYSQTGGPQQTLVEQWNGSIWSVVPSPNVGPSNNGLSGVAAVSANDVWAVGASVTGGIYQTLIEQWNGNAWLVVPSPNPSTNYNTLTRVAAVSADDVWAVGWYDNGGTGQSLVEQWNGNAWSVVPSPNPSTNNQQLLAVAAVSTNDVWAVGVYYTGTMTSTAQTLIEQWNGSTMSLVPSPNVGTRDNILTRVAAVSADDVWAVGDYYTGGTYQTLVEHWNGSTWAVVPSPNVGTTNNGLYGVEALSASDVWAVGYSQSGSTAHTLVERYSIECPAHTPTTTPNPANTQVLPTSSPTSTSVPPTATLPFVDVSTTDWFYTYVQYLYEHHVVNGYNTNPPCTHGTPCFNPGGTTTRGQVSKIMVLGFTLPINTSGGPHFTDVPVGSPFYQYVETMYNAGIITGYGDGTFRPNNYVTRAQITKIVVLSAGWAHIEPANYTFEDITPSNPFYGYVETAYAHRIMGGYPCGSPPAGPCMPPQNRPYFLPSNNATRAQITKIVYLVLFPPPDTGPARR